MLAETLRRAWAAGAGPGEGRLTVDLDSFVGEVHGYAKQGAAYGYTRELGYHPLLATRAGTDEVLHVRLRKGSANTQRGAERFVDELIARVRRAGAESEILLRADSGFQNKKITAKLRTRGCLYSIGVRVTKPVAAAIEAISEHEWQRLDDYPETGEAEIAETVLGDDRLIVRRVRTIDPQQQLFATWQHFAFISNRSEPLALVEREHREHAVVELVIRDLKDQALAHFPSGRFNANAAWTVIACLAHNLHRWSELLGLPDQSPRRARTVRRRLLTLPGRLTRTARRWTLHLPARWPWQHALERPPACEGGMGEVRGEPQAHRPPRGAPHLRLAADRRGRQREGDLRLHGARLRRDDLRPLRPSHARRRGRGRRPTRRLPRARQHTRAAGRHRRRLKPASKLRTKF